MQRTKAIYPVAGVGPRREDNSWDNVRDAWLKAATNGRRLKNALEALESDPKRALQETERLIKKFGVSPPFLACKALALHRQSADPGSRKVQRACEELLNSIPVSGELDELTVLCVLHFYQHQTADYPSLHVFLQKLAAVCKGNSNILDLVWLTYFRNQNPKDMQKAVMDLAKVDAANADKHYVIGVLGLVMQALDGMDAVKKRIILTLAYRTLDKRFPKAKSDEAVLKLWLLTEIGDVDACLPLLDGVRVSKCESHGALIREVSRLLVKAGRLDEAQRVMQESANTGDLAGDFTDVLVDILARRFLIYFAGKRSTVNVAGELVAIVKTFASSLPGQTDRVTIMARLQFFRRLTMEGLEDPELLDGIQTGLMEEIAKYFEAAGDRSCFYSDIKSFLVLLDSPHIQQLENRLGLSEAASSVVLGENKEQFSSISDVIRHQNMLILHFAFRSVGRAVRPTSSSEEDHEKILSTVQAYLSLRVHVTELEGLAKLQSPDMVKLGDAYATLAVLTLFDLFQQTQNWPVLMDIIVLLESTLTKAKPFCNPSLRILLIHLYLRCGAVGLAYTHFLQMDIKALQLNHLSFLVGTSLLVTGVSEGALDLVESVIRFYTGATFDLFDAQLQSITRDRQNYYGVVELELLKSDQKYSVGAVHANYARIWLLPTRRPLTDLEARNWIMESDRYFGPNPMPVLKSFADRGVVPSWDVAFDGQEVDREARLHAQEVAWLWMMKNQMVLYTDTFSLAATYSRYNPFDSTVPLREQLLDHLPAHHLDHVTDGLECVRRSSDALFSACKSADEALPTIWRTNQQEDVTHLTATSFPHPLPIYLSMGCHAVQLRLAQLAAVVEMTLSAGVQTAGGMPAFPVVEESAPSPPPEEEGGKENGTVKKSLGVILSSLEISAKLAQMCHDIFGGDAGHGDSTNIYYYRDMIVRLSLLAQVIRSAVWIIQSVGISLMTLSANNEKRRDTGGSSSHKATAFRKVMEEWFVGFALFLEDLQNPLHALAERLNEETEKLTGLNALEAALEEESARPYRHFPLCSDEPTPQARGELASHMKRQLCQGWKTSLEELSRVINESGSLLTHLSTEARGKIKTKTKGSAS